ncbi:MAG: type II toxin-antitoxin system VapC family toxin [Microcystis sp. M113S1]|uniref:type II toxin-antitoxin system VapC family toxin n=1 Tax=Microcystis sp. M113S1 TaxID=2771104 RepID=UPI001196A7FE|nr:type II toxin-antitoxin system VapC family toxin [Microcystis sp. M113S1]MCA2939108.1 type II toxin-antitoxin system VapC family toxin [Microcystis sp. M113S1]TRV01566.1 MAG: type II toxin-antitoxin system VapC family toxin [Microcystis wesenbergii Mw_QC_S_20081001_S30]
MNKSVLDAAAFLAYLRDEPGAEIVENALINGCYISIINRVEVLSKIVDLGESPEEIIKRLRDEGLWLFVTCYGSIGGHKLTKSFSGKRLN